MMEKLRSLLFCRKTSRTLEVTWLTENILRHGNHSVL